MQQTMYKTLYKTTQDKYPLEAIATWQHNAWKTGSCITNMFTTVNGTTRKSV